MVYSSGVDISHSYPDYNFPIMIPSFLPVLSPWSFHFNQLSSSFIILTWSHIFPYFPIKNHDHDDHLIIFHTFHGKLHEFSIIFRFLGHSIPFQPAQPTLGGDSGDCCCSAARRGADIATGTVYRAGPARLTGRWGAIGRSGCETGELGLKLWKIYENLWYHLVICYIAMENPSEREQPCILFIFKKEATCSHLPLAATCSHLQQVAATCSHLAATWQTPAPVAAASGCQVAAKWLPSGCRVPSWKL